MSSIRLRGLKPLHQLLASSRVSGPSLFIRPQKWCFLSLCSSTTAKGEDSSNKKTDSDRTRRNPNGKAMSNPSSAISKNETALWNRLNSWFDMSGDDDDNEIQRFMKERSFKRLSSGGPKETVDISENYCELSQFGESDVESESEDERFVFSEDSDDSSDLSKEKLSENAQVQHEAPRVCQPNADNLNQTKYNGIRRKPKKAVLRNWRARQIRKGKITDLLTEKSTNKMVTYIICAFFKNLNADQIQVYKGCNFCTRKLRELRKDDNQKGKKVYTCSWCKQTMTSFAPRYRIFTELYDDEASTQVTIFDNVAEHIIDCSAKETHQKMQEAEGAKLLQKRLERLHKTPFVFEIETLAQSCNGIQRLQHVVRKSQKLDINNIAIEYLTTVRQTVQKEEEEKLQ
eukprot:TRINITY_DN34123_c0_g1_i1.p1 TRINITY_DN34123_c0_g1~~TRINITY_DN34123_c0_g1_i1.p1  ORF type:complete len:401 (+),score=53.12 TRINITY_DN34123_c0_g1_i1:61-1263(+)